MPTASPPARHTRASARLPSPNSSCSSCASLFTTRWVSFSYSASSRISPRRAGTSSRVAGRSSGFEFLTLSGCMGCNATCYSRAMRVLRNDDYATLPWKNGLGVSRIIASHPHATSYDAAIWQVGATDIGIDCPFSSLPGLDRQLMLLSGTGVELACVDVVAGIDVRHAVDQPFVPFAFRGDWQTTCKLLGDPVQVLNVMTRRGRAGARISL